MERRNIEYFVAVSEHRSFVRAASTLHVTQPALSHGISALERELGVELFWRKPDGSVLTPAGEAILPAARQVLDGLAGIAALARGAASLDIGRLDIAAPSAWAVGAVADIVGRMRHQAPGVTVRIHGPTRMVRAELLQLLRERQAEIAVIGGDEDPPWIHEGFVSRRLADVELVCIVPDLPRFRRRTSISTEEALELGLVVGPWWDDSSMRDEFAANHGEAVDDRVVVRMAYREAILPLVAAGAGSSFVLATTPRLSYAGVTTLAYDPPIKLSSFVVHRGEPLTPAARLFMRLATGEPAE